MTRPIRVTPVRYEITDEKNKIFMEPGSGGNFSLFNYKGEPEFIFKDSRQGRTKAVCALILKAVETMEGLNRQEDGNKT